MVHADAMPQKSVKPINKFIIALLIVLFAFFTISGSGIGQLNMASSMYSATAD